MAEYLAQDLGAGGYVMPLASPAASIPLPIKPAFPLASLLFWWVVWIIVHPEENNALYQKIREVGAIISDQPLGYVPRAQLFLRRNRLISNLSLGVIVVEAAKQCGSLMTARMALEQGREVFAVPGSPLDPRTKGTNYLIRQGAILTESA